jgi:hypothetical protein
MTRPQRVRVSFELSEEEAERLIDHANNVATVNEALIPAVLRWPAKKVVIAAERGLARYRARKGGGDE